MLSFDPPEPSGVLADLADLTPTLYQALEAGTSGARAFFGARGEPIEPYQFAQTARYIAKKFLDDVGLMVGFEPEDLPNNGLSLVYRGYPLRVRKSYRGGIAPPGSRVLEQFHAQTFLMLGVCDRPNLFVLWDVEKPSHLLAEHLYLACPRGTFVRYPDASDTHWLVQMPNAALTRPVEPLATDDDAADLDYRTPPLDDTGTGEAT